MKPDAQLHREIRDYYGTAMMNGNPMAMMELEEAERASGQRLRDMARDCGIDTGERDSYSGGYGGYEPSGSPGSSLYVSATITEGGCTSIPARAMKASAPIRAIDSPAYDDAVFKHQLKTIATARPRTSGILGSTGTALLEQARREARAKQAGQASPAEEPPTS